MKPGNVKSHIQMPRFILTRFENNNHSFFYYDVKKRIIGTNGHAKSMNTENGYYPEEIEKLLNNEIEQPFSQFLQYIDSLDLGNQFFELNNMDEANIKRFLVSLMVRSPLLIDNMNKYSDVYQFLSSTDQHTIAIIQGLEEADRQKLFYDYRVTFTVNQTAKPFILPISGSFRYGINGHKHIALPISPQITITLIENSGIPFVEKEGRTRLYLITQEKFVTAINKFAFLEQCEQNYGYIISPSRGTLEELLPPYEE